MVEEELQKASCLCVTFKFLTFLTLEGTTIQWKNIVMKMTKTPPRQSSSAIWHKNSNYKCNLSDDKYVVVIDGNFLEKCIINFVSKQQNATLLLKSLFIIMKEFVEFGVQDVLYWANFSNGILADLPQVIRVAFSKVDRDSFWVEGGVIVTYVPKKFIQETVHVENFTLQPKFATRWFNVMNCYRWGTTRSLNWPIHISKVQLGFIKS